MKVLSKDDRKTMILVSSPSFKTSMLTCIKIAYEYLTSLAESKSYDRLIHLIDELKATHDPKAGLDRWTQLFCVYAM